MSANGMLYWRPTSSRSDPTTMSYIWPWSCAGPIGTPVGGAPPGGVHGCPISCLPRHTRIVRILVAGATRIRTETSGSGVDGHAGVGGRRRRVAHVGLVERRRPAGELEQHAVGV